MVARTVNDASAPRHQAALAEIAAGHALDEHLCVSIVIWMAMRYEDSIGARRIYP
jgi:hypothetical protein